MSTREDRVPGNALSRYIQHPEQPKPPSRTGRALNALARWIVGVPAARAEESGGVTVREGLPDRIAERARSPFVRDTIAPLLGIERVEFAPAERMGNALAYVNATPLGHVDDAVNITPLGAEQEGYALDKTLAHELSHVGHYRPLMTSLKRQVPESTKRAENTAARSPRENYAYAFADAQDLLRQAHRLPRREWLQLLERAERNHPGTYGIMQRLVQHPLFERYAPYVPSPEVVRAAAPIQPPTAP